MKWYKFFYFLCFVLVCVGFTVFISEKNYTSNVVVNEKSESKISSNAISMMYETEAGSGEYQISTDTTWPQDDYVFNERLSGCENGGTLSWNEETKRVIMQTNKSDKCYVYFDLFNESTLKDVILQDNPNVLTRTDFSVSYSEDNVGQIFVASGNETEDINNDGVGEDVYYFAGNALNNWVKFGKNENNQDLYWRIIRINEDDSVRMIYSGINPSTTEGYINLNYYMLSSSGIYYLGYINADVEENNRNYYDDSNGKIVIDEWYSKTLNIKSDKNNIIYDNYISKIATYCNDLSHVIKFISPRDRYYFGGYNRLIDFKHPSYKCGNDENGNLYSNSTSLDKFSVSNANGGNGKLQYPIALVTADELAFAGEVNNLSSPTWFYYNSNNESITGGNAMVTMTPRSGTAAGYVNMFVYNNSLSSGGATEFALRPVISLKSCVYWETGNGSSSSPYEVFIDNSCASSN